MKHFFFIPLILALVLVSCISEYEIPPEKPFTSTPIEIGDQVWMSDNMNYPVKENSICEEDNQTGCERLYNWTGAMSACQDGWRLPKKEDWDALEDVSGFSARGYWSDSTAYDSYPDKAYVFYARGGRMEQKAEYKSNFYSVRCIKDTGSKDNIGCVIGNNPCFKTDYKTCLSLYGRAVGLCP